MLPKIQVQRIDGCGKYQTNNDNNLSWLCKSDDRVILLRYIVILKLGRIELIIVNVLYYY